MDFSSKIYVAGHRGLAGSAITRRLHELGFFHPIARTRGELDLRNQEDVRRFFAAERPEYVFLAAARVGGILANSTLPTEFLLDNLTVQNNVIDAAYRHGAKKLLFLGSSCIYPKFAEQPIREEALLTGALEPTNEWYAVAKIAGIKLVQAYRLEYGFCGISLMPTNLYGPGDNFDPNTSHVLPGLIRKFHAAKIAARSEVQVWGTGKARREFLHVDDFADAAVFLMQQYDSPDIINVGFGEDIEIGELAAMIAEVVGFSGEIVFDTTKPDGTPRKLLNSDKLRRMGWKPKIHLREGIRRTYEWFVAHQSAEGHVRNPEFAVQGSPGGGSRY
jgi:GDP-L-fucose synthase